jgi:hypothetical protein
MDLVVYSFDALFFIRQIDVGRSVCLNVNHHPKKINPKKRTGDD